MIAAVRISPRPSCRYIAIMQTPSAQPQILIADDDPVSLRFLATALVELGCNATAVVSGSAAIDACMRRPFDLLLLDRRMPDLGGAMLLRALREQHIGTPAIATSAELDAPMRAELQAAGYADALTKPITLDRLAQALAANLRGWRDPRAQAAPRAVVHTDAAALLDDAAGLASVGGDHSILRALRGLLAGELEGLCERLAALPSPAGLADTLHRLRASCRYCGAPALGDAASQLEITVRADATNTHSEFMRFSDTCARTLVALSSKIS